MKHFICPLGRRGSSRPALGMSPGDQLLWPTWPWSSAMFTLTTAYQPCVGAPPLYPGGGSAMGRPNHCPVRVGQPWTPDIAVGAVQLPVVGVDLRYEVRAHRLRDLRPDIYCVPRWRRWPEPSAALAAACSHGDGQWPWTAGFARVTAVTPSEVESKNARWCQVAIKDAPTPLPPQDGLWAGARVGRMPYELGLAGSARALSPHRALTPSAYDRPRCIRSPRTWPRPSPRRESG